MNAVFTQTGGCLCGRVRYTAQLPTRDGYYCHCRMCQLAFGNTRAAFVNLRKDGLRWTGEQPAYYASSSFARRGFCPRCGTPLSFDYLSSEHVDLAVGSLDDPASVLPTLHFAVESRIAVWHVADGLPEQRLQDHAPTMQRWRESYGEDAVPDLDTVRQAARRSPGDDTA